MVLFYVHSSWLCLIGPYVTMMFKSYNTVFIWHTFQTFSRPLSKVIKYQTL